MFLKIDRVQISDQGTLVDAKLSPSVGGAPSFGREESIEYEEIPLERLKRLVDNDLHIDGIYCSPSIEQFAGYLKDYLIDGSHENHSPESNYTPVGSSTSKDPVHNSKGSTKTDNDNLQSAIKRAIAANDEEGLTDDELDEETKKYIEIDKSLGGGDDSVPDHEKSKLSVKDSDEIDESEPTEQKTTEAKSIDDDDPVDESSNETNGSQSTQQKNNDIVDDALTYTDIDEAIEVVQSSEDLYQTVKDYHSMKPTHLYKLHDFTREVLGGACSEEFFDKHDGVTEDQAQQFAVEFIPEVIDQIDEFSSQNDDDDDQKNEDSDDESVNEQEELGNGLDGGS